MMGGFSSLPKTTKANDSMSFGLFPFLHTLFPRKIRCIVVRGNKIEKRVEWEGRSSRKLWNVEIGKKATKTNQKSCVLKCYM